MPIIHLEDGVPSAKTRLATVGAQYMETIAASGTTRKTFTPPAGKLWEVVTLYLDANIPAGGAAGTHEFELFAGNRAGMLGKSVFGSKITFDYNIWVTADSLQRPATEGGAIAAMTNMIIDINNPFVIDYNNDTDVQNVATLEIWAHVKETPII